MAARSARCVVFAIAFAAGCADSEAIRVLDEAKPDQPPVSIPVEQRQFRTLVAMVPADPPTEGSQNWWFFKLSGPVAVVGKYEDDFNKLIESVRAGPDADDPIHWTPPTGWTRGKQNQMRYATLISPDGTTEVAVSQAGGIVRMNIMRWWVQLWGKEKEAEVTAANLPSYFRQRLVNGRFILLVDMTGPNDPNAKKIQNPHGGN